MPVGVIPTVEWFEGESLTRLDQAPDVTVGESWTPVAFAATSPERVDHAIVAVAIAGGRRATFVLDVARFAAIGPGGC